MFTIFDTVLAQSRVADSVIVSYSGGKDSAVTLDLCSRYFKTVHAFFMYQIPGLSFQEATLRWAESRYGIEIMRLPHFELSSFYRSGSFCRFDGTMPMVSINDVYAHVRSATETHWIAAGERAKDSVVRGAMIKRSGSIDLVRGRFYPLAYWSKAEVMSYIEHHKLKVGAESRFMSGGHSFANFSHENISALKEHYPRDFALACEEFPLIGAAAVRNELYGKDVNKRASADSPGGRGVIRKSRPIEAPVVRDGANAAVHDASAPRQSENHF